MRLRHRDGSTAVMLAALAVSITVGLSACGSSDASSNPTSSLTVPAATTSVAAKPAVTSVDNVPITTAPAATTPPTTVAVVATTAAAATTSTTDAAATMTDAEVADMEKQLDEIDQLLAGVDADLSQD